MASTQPNTHKRGGFSTLLPKKILKQIDENIMLWVSGFLFAFIPLYPKIPLYDIIPGYIVRIRLEDVFIALAFIIYYIQILRKKAPLLTPYTWFVAAYAVAGVLSILSGVYLTATIPAQSAHILKSLLHYFRYLEYFALLFIGFSAVKTRKQMMTLMGILGTVVILASIYGYGQKYLYWPLYSTMNREYSKGTRLYLSQGARVQSTFAGHYDMTGYLVLALPLLLSLGIVSEKRWTKNFFYGSFIMGLWLLMVGASRTSFIAFLVSIGVVPIGYSFSKSTWKKRLWWGFSRSVVLYSVIFLLFLGFGESIYDKFLQVLSAYPQTAERYHYYNRLRKEATNSVYYSTRRSLGLDHMPEIKPPEHAISVSDFDKQIPTITLEPSPTPTPPRPVDVIYEPPKYVVDATESASSTQSTVKKQVAHTYSECALKYGLSLCIRFDTLWPQAIKGFQRNPLFGSGYGTLTKHSVEEFTLADSTDNNFLRTLGETGLFGFLTFYGLIFVALAYASVALQQRNVLVKALAIGYISGTVALLINALLIDVFASSKIAYTYWSVTGFITAYFIHQHVTLKPFKKNK